jgi:hypothetical protein
MAAVSSALFIVVGWFFAPSGGEFELNRSLIRPVYLLAIGWMMAMWGGRETVLRRRIALLRDIGGEWNPRSGMQRTIHANLERIQRFFAASECLLVVRETGQDKCTLYKVAPSSMGTVKSATEMERDIAGVLLDFEPQRALSYDGRAETARGEAPPIPRPTASRGASS